MVKKDFLATILTALGLLVLLGAFVIKDHGVPFAAVFPGALDDLANVVRKESGLGSLTPNPVLAAAAEMKAKDMVEHSYFSHNSPQGKTPWYWLDKAGYKYDYAGENLALNYAESEDVTNAWMNSPTHRANLLKSGYTEVGSAVATSTIKGQVLTFIVEFYGHPASQAE